MAKKKEKSKDGKDPKKSIGGGGISKPTGKSIGGGGISKPTK